MPNKQDEKNRLTMANKSSGLVTVFKRLLAQSTGRIAITCLKPLQVRLDNTLKLDVRMVTQISTTDDWKINKSKC